MAEFQPPEGIRKIAREAAIEAWGPGLGAQTMPILERAADAVLAALFEACEVRESYGVRWNWPTGPVMATGGFIGPREHAERWLKDPPSDECKGELMRRYTITTPGEPVSSTGEETNDGR